MDRKRKDGFVVTGKTLEDCMAVWKASVTCGWDETLLEEDWRRERELWGSRDDFSVVLKGSRGVSRTLRDDRRLVFRENE